MFAHPPAGERKKGKYYHSPLIETDGGVLEWNQEWLRREKRQYTHLLPWQRISKVVYSRSAIQG
jgi:hypothetical protein